MSTDLLKIKTPNVVWLGNHAYVTAPESLEPFLQELRDSEYKVQSMREDPEHTKHYSSTEAMLKAPGGYLWYCSLQDLNRAVCGSCQEYISTVGTRYHGHTCEKCGAILYLDIKDGSRVEFQFKNERQGIFDPELVLAAQEWDADAGWLYLYPEVAEYNRKGYRSFSAEEAQSYLDSHSAHYERIERNGKEVLKMAYHRHGFMEPRNDEDVIEVRDTYDHYWNSRSVKLWHGKEYNEIGNDLPIPESITVYESWHWAPLSPSPRLHEQVMLAAGQIADQGWYHQDGRVGIYEGAWINMRTFVEHFTTLDVAEWDRTRFRTDGPGAIADIAHFCSPDAVITNEPNVGNALIVLGKVMENKPLTKQEAREGKRGLRDFFRR